MQNYFLYINDDRVPEIQYQAVKKHCIINREKQLIVSATKLNFCWYGKHLKKCFMVDYFD